MECVAEQPQLPRARVTGFVYLLYFLTVVAGAFFLKGLAVDGDAGATATNLLTHENLLRLGVAIGLIATALYISVTVLFYGLFKPVNPTVSLLAAFFSLVGLALEALRWQPQGLNLAVAFNGFSCLLIGYLILRSTFLPRILGALMAFSGLAWLTFLSSRLVSDLSPYNLASGVLGQALVMLWLLVTGVNVQRWQEQASAAGMRP